MFLPERRYYITSRPKGFKGLVAGKVKTYDSMEELNAALDEYPDVKLAGLWVRTINQGGLDGGVLYTPQALLDKRRGFDPSELENETGE